jgi:23S rRNA maturation-related 3'-5' exoribonuclease YhaM
MSVELVARQEEVRAEIEKVLSTVKRKGFKKLVDSLDSLGYYTAPASTSHHLSYPGGLSEHSLTVLNIMKRFELTMDELAEGLIPYDSMVIVALFHDIGKARWFDKDLYVPNILKSGKVSEAKPYEKSKERPAIEHEVASVAILEKYIDLTQDEMEAILYHNGNYTPIFRSYLGKEKPLYLLLHFADMWASRVTETKGFVGEDE